MSRNLLTILQLYLVIVLLLLASNVECLYSCSVFNPKFSFEEGIFHGFISSLYGTEEDNFISGPWNENGLIEDSYEEEQLAYGDNWN